MELKVECQRLGERRIEERDTDHFPRKAVDEKRGPLMRSCDNEFPIWTEFNRIPRDWLVLDCEGRKGTLQCSQKEQRELRENEKNEHVLIFSQIVKAAAICRGKDAENEGIGVYGDNVVAFLGIHDSLEEKNK